MTNTVSPESPIARLPLRAGQITPHGSDVLDLARIVSALLVVLYHARILVLGGDPPADWQTAIAYAWANCGTQAVFCFFVLSGYLVGGSVLLTARQNRFSFKSYWIARLSRLYIVLLPALCLGFVLDFTRHSFFGINHHAGYEIDESLQLVTALGNCLFLQTLLVPPFGSNWPLWSLACEFCTICCFHCSSCRSSAIVPVVGLACRC